MNISEILKLGNGDILSISFSEPTNMPPYGNTESIIAAAEVNEMFIFNPPFFIEEVTSLPYTGQWVSPTEFQIKIVYEGYPVPFRTQTIDQGTTITGIKVGEWKMSVSEDRGPCGGFDSNGQRFVNVDRFCLMNSDNTSLPSSSISPLLRWKLRTETTQCFQYCYT